MTLPPLHGACDKERERMTETLLPLDKPGGRRHEGGTARTVDLGWVCRGVADPHVKAVAQANLGSSAGNAGDRASTHQHPALASRTSAGAASGIEPSRGPHNASKKTGSQDRWKASAARTYMRHPLGQGERHDVFTDFLRHA